MYSCTNDDVMDIRGESEFAKILTTDQYIRLLSMRPKRSVEIPKCWHDIMENYFMVSIWKVLSVIIIIVTNNYS